MTNRTPHDLLKLLPALFALVPACTSVDDPDAEPGTDTDAATDTPTATVGSTGGGTDGLDESSSDGSSGDEDCTEVTQDDLAADLTLPAGCYYSETPLFIDGATLTLEAGVDFRFGGYSGATVSGSGALVAVGTSGAPVMIHGDTMDPGNWSGITFSGAASSTNRLEFVDIQGAAGVFVSAGSRLAVASSTFSASDEYGLDAAPESELTITGSTFSDHETPLRVGISTLEGVASDNVFTDNVRQVVVVAGPTVAAAATWNALSVPYEPEGSLFIEAPVTLSPGITITMLQDAVIWVEPEGELDATGTADAPITISGAQAEVGFWRGISYASNSSGNVLEYAALLDAGGDQWTGAADSTGSIYIPGEGRVAVRNTEVRNSEWYALYAEIDSELAAFEGVTIADSERSMRVPVEMGGAIDGGTRFENVADPAVRVSLGSNDTMETDQTWAALDVPWRAAARFFVRADWTLAAGAVFEGAQDLEIYIEPEGAMHTAGTAENPVTLTAPDTVPGYWKGVSIASASTSNLFENTVIDYAGSSAWEGGADKEAAIYIDDEAVLVLDNVTIRNSAGNGVLNSGGNVSCAGMTFEGIAKEDVSTLSGSSSCP